MNLNDGEEDLFFNQHCLELAKLLRTEQTEDFLHLYDSSPSEWNGSRLETAKEYIRQLQELDENEFEVLYQKREINNNIELRMSNLLPPLQSSVNHNDDEQILTTNSRITSPSIIKRQQIIERTTANDQAYDEIHDIRAKHSLYKKMNNNEESNTKSRRLQSITNNNPHDMKQNNSRTRNSVDSFVQMNLTREPPSIDIKLEDYKKTIAPMSTIKSSTSNRPGLPQSVDTIESNQASIIQSLDSTKKHHHHHHHKDKSHEEASFDYFCKTNEDDDDDDRQRSRSSSSTNCSTSDSSTSNNCRRQSGTIETSPTNPFRTSYKTDDLSKQTNQTLLQSIKSDHPFEHGKLIPNNGFDSHGSSTATKSSSDNSGGARTGSGSDSDEEHHHHHIIGKNNIPLTKLSPLYSNQSNSKTKFLNYDDTPTIVLNKTSDNPTSQYDSRISSLPEQESYQLVKLTSNNEDDLVASQVPRFKLPATDDPNGNNNSSNELHSYTTQRSQQNSLSSSSHQTRNNERHEQYNTNHSNSSRKTQPRPTKKRKQSNQQDIIRTELIPGHRGDRDVDELVMFIDGNSSTKQQQQQQRQTSVPLRPTDTNKVGSTSSLPDTNSNGITSRRKSRKPIQILQESNENKITSPIDEDTQSIGFIDEDDQTRTIHSINNTFNEQNTTSISLPNDDESHSNAIDIDSTNDSNTTNGESSLPDWYEATRSTSPHNDDIDSFSLSSTTLNNSNSEIISEPFVTVTHRRRLTKERRQDNNNSSRFPPSSNINDKRRLQSSSSSSSTTQNGIIRSSIRNSLSNIKPFVSTTTKEENTPPPPSPSLPQTSVLPPPPPPPPSSSSVSNTIPEQSSPRLSSHSSSSSLSSLLKRQSKVPPVVFLNKSIDVELNGVSFGFDIDKPSSSPPPPVIEKENEIETNTLSSDSPTVSSHSNEFSTNSKSFPSRRPYQQQRNHRGPLFYSGSDIRPNHHHHNRNYPSQPPVPQSPYIDPLLLLQYNQQRLAANYSQQLAYMNLIRAQYLTQQPQYVILPTNYTTTAATNNDDDEEKTLDDETSSEQITEPLLVYTTVPTQTGQIYYHPQKKSFNDLEQQQQQQQQQTSIPNVYPPQFFYPTQQNVIPPHTAYFQPISSPSLLIDSKSQQDDTDNDDGDEDNDYEKSTRLFHQTRQQSSSHIMSNALQLVYSQERRNTQTDRFNLDQLTAYLAMKWTDTIDHYEQGDDETLFVGEQ